MTDETALPIAEAPEAPAGAGEQQTNAAPADENQEAQQPEQAEQPKDEKPEALKALERELAKERRRNQALARRTHAAEFEAQQLRGQPRDNLQSTGTDDINSAQDGPKALSEADLERLVEARLAERQTLEQRQAVIDGLAKKFGQERFDSLANDLDAAFGGLKDSQGRPRDAVEAIFGAADPAAVIEHLADPDNEAEAKAIAKARGVQAGYLLAKIEAKLAAKPEKPQPSKAPRPLEPVRGGAVVDPDPAKMTDAQWLEHRRKTGR